jgi:trk system potassium uptake protein
VNLLFPARAGDRGLRGRLARQRATRPAAFVAALLAGVVVVGTVLLMLPFARSGPGGAPLITALFTSTSAVSVTGLATVDTATYWSGFGEAVILLLVQVGGLGITTGAALLSLLVSRRLGLRARLYTSTETGVTALGDVRRVVVTIAALTFAVELFCAVVLTLRWWLGYDEPFGHAVWLGVFHAVTAFNNAGFALFSNSLMGFAGDPVILLTVSAAIILGGIGIPVLFDLFDPRRGWRAFSLHSRVTIWVTLALLAYGLVGVLASEWDNPATFGPMSVATKTLNAWFGSVSPRTAGFNTFDYADANPETLLVTNTLMFIGGGSVSTAGGIRVTTLAVLLLVLWAQARGDREVDVGSRRLSLATVQQALTITVVFAMLSVAGTLALIPLSGADLDQSLFEVISALGTVGLSAGLTGSLDTPAQLLLALLMFVGRVGPTTLAVALALRARDRRYHLPEGRVLVG